eukprot:CAMPEP_0172425372 /NCGR_PEP_ID=MMETSP1064-20121228/31725_1 /TAXON_ID=202472 /ORGANISM="Aulacoseira subarctica , Strain CCAP 1002/5" /LENGTH=611 /DNA_ID=CAMNT_0013168183 /DNA_START=69 /DNA_END=1904 /DNA_ORIENTATION=+
MSIRTPPSADVPPIPFLLPSCFPRDVPIGLRREAVFNALHYSRGLCINLSDLNSGVVHVKGKGCRDFLNSKLSNSFPPYGNTGQEGGSVREACLLTPKGRVVDKLTVAYFNSEGADPEAFILTSPDLYRHYTEGASSVHDDDLSQYCYLYRKLSPLVFPLDQIVLSDATTTSTMVSISCSDIKVLNDVVLKTLSSVMEVGLTQNIKLPKPGEAMKFALTHDIEKDSSVIIACNSFLLNIKGYILLVRNDRQNRVRNAFCNQSDDFIGALPIQALEYETLRIDLCIPAVGREIMGDKDSPDGSIAAIKSGPLEIGLRHAVDLNKGCYLGQEGVAAQSRNPRGVPRTIYQVVFNDIHVDPITSGQSGGTNPYPKAGDTLFVLGSNEAIKAGVLTSVVPQDDIPPYYDDVGEIDESLSTVGMALIRRAEYIIQKMEDLGLDSIGDTIDPTEFRSDAPLHGLEVIVGGTYMVGTLRAVPFALKEMQQEELPDSTTPSTVMGFIDTDARVDLSNVSEPEGNISVSQEEIDFQVALEEADRAKKAAEASAAEAKRAADKLEALKARAEAAKDSKQRMYETQEENKVKDVDEEAARKKEKIAILKARADAAMAARRKK